MAQTWKAGDVVRLKSGSPELTVMFTDTQGNHDRTTCAWFNGKKDEFQEVSFVPDALAEVREKAT